MTLSAAFVFIHLPDFIWHSVQDLRFPLGRESTVLCHVRNKGGPLNVTFMRGSLNFPFDFSIQLVELSSEPVNIQIPADGEATLEYPFMVRHTYLHPVPAQYPNPEVCLVSIARFGQILTRSITRWRTQYSIR